MTIQLDILQTLAVAVIVLYVGKWIKRHVRILERFCIPDPVVGGILFSLLTLVGYATNTFVLEMDTTLQSVCMTMFFTSVGFTCDVKVLLKYGKRAIAFAVVLTILVCCQDAIGVFFANLFGINPLLGLCAGSAAMVGGHGTVGSFAPMFEADFGCEGAVVYGLAAATFGLVSGGLIGGPVGNFIVKRYHLEEEAKSRMSDSLVSIEDVEVPLSAGKMVLDLHRA